MTLLFAIQKTLRSEVTAHSFTFFVCIIYPQYKYAYVHNYSAHGHELSGCVRADADALGPYPGPVLCMIRERHVILKAALHSGLYSCLAAASYIIMLYCLVYSFFLINEYIV